MQIHERFLTYVPLFDTIQKARMNEYRNLEENRGMIEKMFCDIIHKEMNLFDMPDGDIFHLVRPLLLTIAHGYGNRKVNDKEFCENVMRRMKDIQVYLRNIDILELDEYSHTSLGFGNWRNDMNILPLYLFPCLKKGTILLSTEGEECVVGEHRFDLETIFGCIKYGMKTKQNV